MVELREMNACSTAVSNSIAEKQYADIWELAHNGRVGTAGWQKLGPILWNILLNNRFNSFIYFSASFLV